MCRHELKRIGWLICLVGATACAPKTTSHLSIQLNDVRQALAAAGTTSFSDIIITVSAADIAVPLVLHADPNSQSLDVDLPAGPDRGFEAVLLHGGSVVYYGDVHQDLPAGGKVEVVLPVYGAGVLSGTLLTDAGDALPAGYFLRVKGTQVPALATLPTVDVALGAGGAFSQTLVAGTYDVQLAGGPALGALKLQASAQVVQGQITTLALQLDPNVKAQSAVVPQLVFAVAPAAQVSAGAPLPVTLHIVDDQGNIVTSANQEIVLSVDVIADTATTTPVVAPIAVTGPITSSTAQVGSAGGLLMGTTTVRAVAGVAQFTDLSMQIANAHVTLLAHAVGLTDVRSAPFSVLAADLARLILVAPSSAVVGVPFSLSVSAVDSWGNYVQDTNLQVSFTATDKEATLPGPTTLAVGENVFAKIVILHSVGAQAISVADTTGQFVASSTVSVTASPIAPAALSFGALPATTQQACTPFTTGLQVHVVDAQGNPLDTGDMVQLSVVSSPNRTVLRGVTQAATLNGVADFDYLWVLDAGTYQFSAALGGLSATSPTFTVNDAPPVQVMLAAAQASANSGLVPINFQWSDACHRPPQIDVSYSLDGDINNAAPATQGPNLVGGLTFVWDAGHDLGANVFSNTGVARVCPRGSTSQCAVTPFFSVSTGLVASSFSPNKAAPLPTLWSTMRVGDLNHDGYPDYVGANSDNPNFGVMLGHSAGTVVPGGTCAVPSMSTAATGMALGDVNGDGNLDLVASYLAPQVVQICYGDGQGGFVSGTASDIAAGDVHLADMDRDGKLDLIAPTRNGNVLVALNTGFRFGTPATYAAQGGNVSTDTLGVGDLNNDGMLDVALLDGDSSSLMMLFADQTGALTLSTHGPTATQLGATGLTLYDIDNDGTLDALCVNPGSQSISYFPNYGGIFYSPADVATLAPPSRVVLGTLDASAQLVAVVAQVDGGLQVFPYNRGFNDSFSLPGLFPTLNGLAMADMNRDGRNDIVGFTSVATSATINAYTNNTNMVPRLTPVAARIFGTGAMRSVAVGDFDGDTRPDLIAAHPTENRVSLHLGTGDAGLRAGVDTPLADSPLWVAAADFNRDGSLDFITSSPSSFSVFLGDGAGNFSNPIVSSASSGGIKIATGDFNEDGLADVAALSALGYVSLSLGGGDGTLVFSKSYSTPGAVDLQAVDLNADGHLDVLTANGTNDNVGYLLGDGNANLQSMPTVGLTANAQVAVAFDINGDSLLDIVVASPNQTSLLLGDQNNTFALNTTVSGCLTPTAITYGTFDSSGPAALVSCAEDHSVEIFSWGAQTFYPNLPRLAGGNGMGVAAADLQNAGYDNMIVIGDGRLTIYPHDATMGIIGPRFVTAGTSTPQRAVLGDFDGNMHPDLLVTDANLNQIAYLPGETDGYYQPATLVPLAVPATDVVAADFDRDGFLDMVVSLGTGNLVSRFSGTGTGTFSDANNTSTVGGRGSLATTDFNHDGWPDVLVAHDSGGTAGYVSLLLGSSEAFTVYELPLGAALSGIVTTDFNHDGHADVAVADGSSVRVATGDGNVTLSLSSTLDAPTAITALAMGDLDRDGIMDLAAASQGAVNIYMGRGDATFSGPVGVSVEGVGVALQMGDVDADGALDVVMVDSASSRTQVLLGDDHGGIARVATLLGDQGAGGLVLGDVNEDGQLDIIAVGGINACLIESLSGFPRPAQ